MAAPALRAAALAVALALAGCLLSSGARAHPLPDLGGTSWAQALPKAKSCDLPPEITFEKDGTLAGNAGCNDFRGTWSRDGDKLSLRFEPSSSYPCGKAKLALEASFSRSLRATVSARLEGSALLLLDAGGRELARLEPAFAGACR